MIIYQDTCKSYREFQHNGPHPHWERATHVALPKRTRDRSARCLHAAPCRVQAEAAHACTAGVEEQHIA